MPPAGFIKLSYMPRLAPWILCPCRFDVPSFARLRAGLSELHAWQSSFGSLDLQSGVVGHGRQLAVDGLRMAVADGRPEVLFEWSERARALASRIIPVRPPADERVRAQVCRERLAMPDTEFLGWDDLEALVAQGKATEGQPLELETRVVSGSGAPCGGISRSRGQAMVVPAADGTDVGMVIDMTDLRVARLCRRGREKVRREA